METFVHDTHVPMLSVHFVLCNTPFGNSEYMGPLKWQLSPWSVYLQSATMESSWYMWLAFEHLVQRRYCKGSPLHQSQISCMSRQLRCVVSSNLSPSHSSRATRLVQCCPQYIAMVSILGGIAMKLFESRRPTPRIHTYCIPSLFYIVYFAIARKSK